MPKSPQVASVKRASFLAAYRECGVIKDAAKAAGVSRHTHHDVWMKDPEYVSEFNAAHQDAIESLESEARHRAVEGDWVLKFEKGRMITVPLMDSDGKPILDENGNPQWVPYRERRKSDTLLIFLLKGACPEKYAERAKVDVRNVTQEDVARFEEQYGLKRLDDAFDNPSQ